jgi:DNA-directed RNA polymerase specialized sigma24 family protein
MVLIEKQQDFFCFLIRRLGSRDIAGEMLHQTYLRAVSKAFALKKQQCSVAWLYQVLKVPWQIIIATKQLA